MLCKVTNWECAQIWTSQYVARWEPYRHSEYWHRMFLQMTNVKSVFQLYVVSLCWLFRLFWLDLSSKKPLELEKTSSRGKHLDCCKWWSSHITGNILWLWNELNKIAKWWVLQSISPLCYVPVFLQRIWCFSNPDQNKCSTFWLTPPSKKDATPTCHPVWVASRCSWEESNCKQAERWTFHTPQCLVTLSGLHD